MADYIDRQAAIDIVKGIDSNFAKYIEELPSAQPEQRWIPVTERLPKDKTDCLITYSNGFVEIATFVEDLYEVDEYDFHDKRGVAGWYYFDPERGTYFDMDNVTAWMHLPDSYKGE